MNTRKNRIGAIGLDGESSGSDFDDFGNTANSDQLISSSTKLSKTAELLDKWSAEGNKVLLFTQTRQMQALLEKMLRLKRFKFLVMSGTTKVTERHNIVEEFQRDPTIFVFLLTTRVGGLGLNLTAANRVIIYDSDWNPTVDRQAKMRIHRYGQTSHVEMYRLVCKNTVEEKIFQKQIYKDCLSKKILGNPKTRLSYYDAIGMFSYKDWDETEDGSGQAKDDDSEDNDSEAPSASSAVARNSNDDNELVEIYEGDRLHFEQMKSSQRKRFLTGKELLEHIRRRESNLNVNY